MHGMDGNTRSCWLTLLCYASISENPGIVDLRYVTEDLVMLRAGVPMGGEGWERTAGVFEKFIEKEMVFEEDGFLHVKNWLKRQESYLTGAERVRKHRGKQKDEDDVTDVTLEENRIEKNREEEKPHKHLKYLTELPPEDLKELTEKYDANSVQVRRKAEQFSNYCVSKPKKYANYRAALENALDKDFGRRVKLQPKAEEPEAPLDAEALARVDALKLQIKNLASKKTI